MSYHVAQDYLFRTVVFSLLVFSFLVFGVITGYNPVISLLLVSATVFVFAYYLRPHWFAYLYIFILSFAALFHLPVTRGGFSSAVAVAMFSFMLGFYGSLALKDRRLVYIFSGRIDHLLVLTFFVFMLVSIKNSMSVGYSIKQVQQFFYIVVIYYFLQLIIYRKEFLRRAVFVLLVGGACVGLLGLVEAVLQQPIYFLLGHKSLLGASVSDALLNAKPGRINGLIGDAPFHGAYMTVIAVFSLYFFATSGRGAVRWLYIPVFLLSVFNIVGTGSRGAFIGLLLALFLFWAVAEIRRKTAIMISTLFIGAVLVVSMLVIVPHLNVTRSFTFSEETSHTAEMRWKNIPVALKIFADHPVFGSGPDGFVINYTRYAPGLTNLAFREKILKTHNTPLQVLAEYGLVGITIFGLIIFLAYKRMAAVVRRGEDWKDRMLAVSLIASISAYLFFMATSNTLLDKYFWLLISLAQIHYSTFNRPSSPES